MTYYLSKIISANIIPIGSIKYFKDRVDDVIRDDTGLYVKTGTTYAQSDFPELFDAIGHGGGVSYFATATSGTNSTFNSITYGNGLFVAVGNNGAINIGTGKARTSITGVTAQVLHTITYGNGLFVAGGGAGVLFSSTNGITWTSRTSGTSSAIFNVTYTNNLYVYTGINCLATSTDAITWTPRAYFGANVSTNITGTCVIYANGEYLLYGQGLLQTTTDFITFRTFNSGSKNSVGALTISQIPSSTLGNIIYSNGVYYAHNDTQIVSSTNLNVWKTETSNPRNRLVNSLGTLTIGTLRMIKQNDKLFLVSQNGWISTSTDFRNWSILPAVTAFTINDIVYGNGYYMYCGASGALGIAEESFPLLSTSLNPSTEFTVPAITTMSADIVTTGNYSTQLIPYIKAKER